jgi:hypothetical protein
MNLGFFGFPSYLDTSIIEIAKYDYSGTFYVKENVNFLDILVIGGGGGGGGGRRSTLGTSAYGGGGGASGLLSYTRFPVIDLVDNFETRFSKSRTLGITIGAGGAGGAGRTGTDGNGSAGSGGGYSFVFINDLRFNTGTNSIIQVAAGGAGGSGGTNSLGTAGVISDGLTAHNNFLVTRRQVSNGNNATLNDTLKTMYRNTLYSVWGSSGGSLNTVGTKFERQINIIYSNVINREGQFFLGYSDPSNYIMQGGANGDQFKCLTTGIGNSGAGGYAIDANGLLTGSQNGGYGIRGGGGGGGGGSLGVNAGNGGKGGDGFCLIIARST